MAATEGAMEIPKEGSTTWKGLVMLQIMRKKCSQLCCEARHWCGENFSKANAPYPRGTAGGIW